MSEQEPDVVGESSDVRRLTAPEHLLQRGDTATIGVPDTKPNARRTQAAVSGSGIYSDGAVERKLWGVRGEANFAGGAGGREDTISGTTGAKIHGDGPLVDRNCLRWLKIQRDWIGNAVP